ncbi:MAG TPA: glycosyltransferase family 2 protein [Candidatus Babeliales bacterium]|jgi:glycosyltransferase involved in cell wall biosynthesis|nr:glycosyltransferase family 2 protein [Candidatus Babeliales bacterium]
MQLYFKIICFLFVTIVCNAYQHTAEKLLVIVIPSYNNEQWYQHNLSSIFMQEYSNYYIIYIDDCSTDNTYTLVKEYIHHAGQEHRVILIRNPERKGHLYNHIQAVQMAEPHAIIVHIDGDDWLRLDHPRTDIFQMINHIYDDTNVWLTYGSYYRYPYSNIGSCRPFPADVIEKATYREFAWVSSHLRTFYAWLFKQIDKNDFIYTGSDPAYQKALWPAAVDLAFMFPMLEMAAGRIFYVKDIIYTYNRANVLNLCEGPMRNIQNDCAQLIRNKKPYKPLDQSVFWHYMGLQ